MPFPAFIARPPSRPSTTADALMLGFSSAGRPIDMHFLGDQTARLRILVVAGQHGDERAAILAAHKLAAFRLRDVAVALVPCLNPDGYALNQRANAQGTDLNRDHLLLSSPETQALHVFVARWQPHLILDVHTYPPRREALLKQNLVHCHDVLLGVPTHPAVSHPLLAGHASPVLSPLTGLLAQQGLRAHRYLLVNDSGRIRHSTPDIRDARNSLSLRYGALTLLVEGRARSRKDLTPYRSTAEVLTTTLRTLIAWAKTQPDLVRHQRAACLKAVPIAAKYTRATAPLRMPFQDADTGAIRPTALTGRYTPKLRVTQSVGLPAAYAVPCGLTRLHAVLARHGFEALAPEEAGYQPGHLHATETYWIDHVRPSKKPERAPRRLHLQAQPGRRGVRDHLVYLASPGQATSLAVLLEPGSKYGLHRFPETGLTLWSGSAYPVLRVM